MTGLTWIGRYLWQHRRDYGIGLASLLFVDMLNVLMPYSIKLGIDALVSKNASEVILAGLSYLLLMLVQAVGRYYWRIYIFGTSYVVANSLRIELFQKLTRVAPRALSTIRSGDLMSRATNDIEAVRTALGPGILISADAVMLLGLMIPAMALLSGKLAVLSLAFLPVVPLLTFFLGRRIERVFEEVQERMSRMSAFVQESFVGIRLVKSLAIESTVEAKFEQMSGHYRDAASRLASSEALLSPLLGLLTNLGTFVVLLVGGNDVLAGALSVGSFVAFQRYIVQLAWPMEAIGWAVTMLREGSAAHKRVDAILKKPSVVEAFENTATSDISEALLEIRGVEHDVRGDSRLFHLSIPELKIMPGGRVGVVGPIGSGKTTLFDLILRLDEPQSGQVFLRGENTQSIRLSELRRRVACVEQAVTLFSESVRENLTLGLTRTVSDSELWGVLRVAALDEEAKSWPQQLDSRLGERGVTLSGGQKQRLALARALLRKPELLLLDDSFSAVDVEVEQRIIANLRSYRPDLAICFASHRLAIMPELDAVWLLDRGLLVAEGTHGGLMKLSSLYRGLWARAAHAEESHDLASESQAGL